MQGVQVEYFGHALVTSALSFSWAHQCLRAHASVAPWEGSNALDAAFLAYSAVSVLRQQVKPENRVHGVVCIVLLSNRGVELTIRYSS
jgi:metal-dependent amidase/aminoacylase/carboxypeptidase family protein